MFEELLIFAAIIFLGYYIKGLTGFAGALISIPLLLQFHELIFIIPIISVIDMLSGVALLPSVKKIDKREMIFIFVGVIIGTLVGLFILFNTEGDLLKTIFAVFLILFGIKMVFEKYLTLPKLPTVCAPLFGFGGGVIGGTYSTNGPIITMYLANQIKNKQILRGTMIVIFLVDAVWRNSLYAFNGLFTKEMLTIILAMIPVLILASWAGTRTNLKVKEDTYRKIVGALLVISGFLLF